MLAWVTFQFHCWTRWTEKGSPSVRSAPSIFLFVAGASSFGASWEGRERERRATRKQRDQGRDKRSHLIFLLSKKKAQFICYLLFLVGVEKGGRFCSGSPERRVRRKGEAMETEFGKRGECPQLLDLIPSEKDWPKRDTGSRGEGKGLGASDEKKLELRLAPPGEGWPLVQEVMETQAPVLPSSYFSKFPKLLEKIMTVGAKRGFSDTTELKSEGFQRPHEKVVPFQLQVISGLGKESSHETNGRMQQQQILERKVHAAPKDGSLVESTTQIRTTSAPVVGWPPIRSFRKNIASSSVKPSYEPQNAAAENKLKHVTSKKGFFVKINMDGIPIGRKVDLNAYDDYQKLSSAVEELFCGLLAAQNGTTACETGMSKSEKLAFTGLLDGSGEYALVYEDNEGDKMLVGDVPWDMFVSTAKRLRVLKNSELLLYLWKQHKK